MIRLSLPIKVILAGGIAYLVAIFGTTALTVHYHLDVTTNYFGLPLKSLYLLFHIFFVLLAICLASFYFFDRPLTKLTRTMNMASEGDFLIRAPQLGSDEMGRLSQNFNQMLVKWTDLSARKIQADHDLIVAQEELKYKKMIQRANRQLENLVKDLSLLYEIGQKINQAIEIQPLYEELPAILNKHLNLENFSLMIWDEKKSLLQIKSAFGFTDMEAVKEITFHGGEGIAGEALKTGRAIYVPDVNQDRRFARRAVVIEGSVLSAPLSYKGGVFGVVNFGRDKLDGFGPQDIKMFTLVANQIALAMANAKLYTQTRELSVTDELTGVFNRRHFSHVMQLEWKRAVRFKRDLSLLMIDVDYFKRYNDSYGHLKGDEVLKRIAKLLGGNLREVDTVARFGGEEFIVLLPDTDKRGALAVAEKLRNLIQEGTPGITVSIGVANHPEDVTEMEDLIDHADIALYEAKDQGRNRVVLFLPSHKTGSESKSPFVH